MDKPVARLSEGARYVEALLILDALDRPLLSRCLVNVIYGARTGKVSLEAVEAARRTVAEVSVSLQVSSLSPWTSDMSQYQDGLKELLDNEVEDARRRVEERVSRLRVRRLGMRRGVIPSTATDKTREYVSAAQLRLRVSVLTPLSAGAGF